MRTIFNAENANLARFERLQVDYAGKLSTEAVQVSVSNIGALALEFEAEVFTNNGGVHYITVYCERTDPRGQKSRVGVAFSCGDWIVIVAGELHRFPDEIFKNTFRVVRVIDDYPQSMYDEGVIAADRVRSYVGVEDAPPLDSGTVPGEYVRIDGQQ